MGLDFKTVLDVIGHTAPFARCRLHQCVGSNSADEVGSQIGRELSVAFVAEHLHAAHDGGFVDAVALSERA